MAEHNGTSMTGKTVVVTGGNAGIGREAAVELARRGATVVNTARDDAARRLRDASEDFVGTP